MSAQGTISVRARATSSSTGCISGSVGPASNCAWIASSTAGWRYPRIAGPQAHDQSVKVRPVSSVISQPSARTANRGKTASSPR